MGLGVGTGTGAGTGIVIEMGLGVGMAAGVGTGERQSWAQLPLFVEKAVDPLCSRSRRRAAKVDKRMYLDYTHG